MTDPWTDYQEVRSIVGPDTGAKHDFTHQSHLLCRDSPLTHGMPSNCPSRHGRMAHATAGSRRPRQCYCVTIEKPRHAISASMRGRLDRRTRSSVDPASRPVQLNCITPTGKRGVGPDGKTSRCGGAFRVVAKTRMLTSIELLPG